MVKSFLFLAAAFLLVACSCGTPETIQQYDLEERCGSLPCGVNLVSGNASIVSTFHAGEHGILLEKNSVIRIDHDATKSAPLKFDVQLHVLFQCDENTSFDVVLGSEDASGPTEVNLTGMPIPVTNTDELLAATFPIPVPDSLVPDRPQLRFLQFTTVGPGGCTLDDIWVFVPHLCQG